MNKIIRYFNQNRRKIYTIIVIVAFGYFLLQFANYMAANSYNNIEPNKVVNQNENIIVGQDNINIDSAITGTTGGTTAKKETEVIQQFIQYCNEGKTTEAYNMLSNECKENIYPKLDNFIKDYYKNNFNESKSFNIQRWTGSIYKVDLKENMLHTGKISTENKQDVMTVVYDEGTYKLNINSFIRRTQLNKLTKIEDISIKILYKDTYMNYETYIFEVENKSGKNIYLDNLEKSSTTYIVDENDVKHTANLNELGQEQLQIYPYSKNEIQITFSNSYISGRDYSKIVFENVILDEANNESKKISINLQ